MKIAIRQSQKINSRIHNSRIAIRQRIAQLGMEPHVKWHISGRKLYFRFLMFQNGSKNQYLGFQQISRKSVKVEPLTYHVTRPLGSHKGKISLFQNMLGFIQYGSRLFGIDASSDSAKFQDDWLSESGLNVKFQNQKLAKNGEFDK